MTTTDTFKKLLDWFIYRVLPLILTASLVWLVANYTNLNRSLLYIGHELTDMNRQMEDLQKTIESVEYQTRVINGRVWELERATTNEGQ